MSIPTIAPVNYIDLKKRKRITCYRKGFRMDFCYVRMKVHNYIVIADNILFRIRDGSNSFWYV